jgi:hypothetical protein
MSTLAAYPLTSTPVLRRLRDRWVRRHREALEGWQIDLVMEPQPGAVVALRVSRLPGYPRTADVPWRELRSLAAQVLEHEPRARYVVPDVVTLPPLLVA